MAIHIKNEQAEWLLRDYAKRNNLGLVEAIIKAVTAANAQQLSAGEQLKRKIQPILDEIKAKSAKAENPPFDPAADKAFMDEGWGEEPG